MVKEKHSITMVTFIKVNFWKVKGVEKDYIHSKKYSNMLGNGSIIVFGDKENSWRMSKHFLKEVLKKVWSMEMENIDMIMEIIFKEIILKMVKEAKENIILVKVVFLNLNLILHLLKFLKYI